MLAVSIDWIFENLQFFIILAAVIASMVSKVLKKRSEQDAADRLPPKVPVKGLSDADAARVREEIARKRAERMRLERPPSPFEAPRPVATPERIPEIFRRRVETPPPLPPEPVEVPRADLDREDAERTLARQLALAEKMKELNARRDALARQAASPILGEVKTSTTARRVHAETLLASARNPAELRKAIVMTEILGKPLALR